jgi:hypothetical protein
MITVQPEFKIYVTTNSKNADYGSELSQICTLINFSTTPEAFTQRILALTLQELEPNLHENILDCRKTTLAKL